jgi:hypothetical protein
LVNRRLDQAVGEPVEQGVEDAGLVLANPAGEVDERGQPGPGCPLAPGLEHLDGPLMLHVEDLAELLFEEVGPVEWPVPRLDPRQLRLLPLGEVLGVAPQDEPGALELAGLGGHPLVPGEPSVERFA